ncbi:MAG: glycosyltransferase, partial [Terriglobales bacterium]
SSTVFLGLALVAARRFKRQAAIARLSPAGATPPLSVIKPVHGMEPRLRENLESFFLQDYPDFELLFCARRRDDAALLLVDELCRAHPQVKVKILTCGEPAWTNPKLYSMHLMTEAAAYEIVVFSDSDVYVHPEYLREVTRPLNDPRTGMVTCLYRGMPAGGTVWSRMEGLGMSVELTSGVLIAQMLEGMKFALAPTMATRKEALAKTGGLAPLADHLADDFWLGNRIQAAGYEVVLSHHVIDHMATHGTWAGSWRHQVGWMKNTRRSRPKGHLGAGLTFAMPFGMLGLAAATAAGRPWLGAGFLGWAVLNRMAQCVAIGWGVVRDREALRSVWLYPFRDLLGSILWVAGYSNNIIDYRGEKYRIQAGGRIEKAVG